MIFNLVIFKENKKYNIKNQIIINTKNSMILENMKLYYYVKILRAICLIIRRDFRIIS